MVACLGMALAAIIVPALLYLMILVYANPHVECRGAECDRDLYPCLRPCSSPSPSLPAR